MYFRILLSLLFILSGFTQIECKEFASQTDIGLESSALQKIYVTPDQIHIIPEGIFFLNEEGNLIQACGIFSDQSGIYAVAARYKCPACGWWNNNNICNNTGCPLYGK